MLQISVGCSNSVSAALDGVSPALRATQLLNDTSQLGAGDPAGCDIPEGRDSVWHGMDVLHTQWMIRSDAKQEWMIHQSRLSVPSQKAIYDVDSKGRHTSPELERRLNKYKKEPTC